MSVLHKVCALLMILVVGSAHAVSKPWSTADALATGRELHTATLLSSGKVLVAGGYYGGSLASAELYDPATNSWSAAGALLTARYHHTATLLSSGSVLVAGGGTASAELYNPATNSWSAAGSLSIPRNGHTATLLPSGKVLVVGGDGAANILGSAELYDPATNSWSAAASLANPRDRHTATLLPSGKVLVAGGYNVGFLTTAELYDPLTDNWSTAGSLATGRAFHTATLLLSGKVLVVAGAGNNAGFLASAELYDPATNDWSTASPLALGREYNTATLLPSGRVLVAGGSGSLASTELYDPATDTWSPAGSMANARDDHTATLLISGKVLVAGGSYHGVIASAELYDPEVKFNPGFLSLSPTRLLDTRFGSSTIDGQFAGIGAARASGVIDLVVAGRGGVPSNDVVAVVLNVTATNPTASGYIAAWPSEMAQPLASNLNFTPGKTVPNLVIANVGTNGKVSLYNSAGTTDLIADVAGYFSVGTDLNTLSPARLLDTRAGFATIDGQFQGTGALSTGGTLTLAIGGRDGIPSSGVGAAILNVTAVQPTAMGYLTLWPSDAAQPWASNLNFMPGDDIPNLVISKVSASGDVSIYNSAGNTDVVADVAGWFPSSSQLTPVVPARIMDTRPGAQTIDGQAQGIGAIQSNGTTNLPVLNRGGVPASGVGAVVLNVTVTEPTAPGYLTVWPVGESQPLASSLNFVANQTIANLVIMKISTNTQVEFYNGSNGKCHVVVDVVGWFAEQ